MDIERTMEFILQQQAKAEAELAAMRQQAQKVSETKLQCLIASMRRGGNGNHRNK